MATALIRQARSASSSGRRGLSAAVNYMKSGSPPGASDDGTTPAWTADLASPPPTAFELRRRAEKEGEAFAVDEAAKLFKLEARARIKARNAVKAKK